MVSTADNSVHLTVDIVLLAAVDGVRHVLLVRRGDDSDAYPGWWALPGGYVDAGEWSDTAARRELAEETSVTAPISWQKVGTYEDPSRDPRGRVVSIAYAAVLADALPPRAGDDAQEACWVPLYRVLDVGVTNGLRLAFDHEKILRDAVQLA